MFVTYRFSLFLSYFSDHVPTLGCLQFMVAKLRLRFNNNDTGRTMPGH